MGVASVSFVTSQWDYIQNLFYCSIYMKVLQKKGKVDILSLPNSYQISSVHEMCNCNVERLCNAETLQGLGFIPLLFVRNGDDFRSIKAFMNLVTAADKFITQTFF